MPHASIYSIAGIAPINLMFKIQNRCQRNVVKPQLSPKFGESAMCRSDHKYGFYKALVLVSGSEGGKDQRIEN